MKHLDEYRDGAVALRLIDDIRRLASRRWSIMEVCGGQTHSLLRYGIEAALDGVVELIHGPGCPVCVTPVEAIDFAQDLALRDGVQVASFGDMLRVPGSRLCIRRLMPLSSHAETHPHTPSSSPSVLKRRRLLRLWPSCRRPGSNYPISVFSWLMYECNRQWKPS
jgi:hypothetical protein